MMQLLYQGHYRGRFAKIAAHLKGKKVTELCFGDTYIAKYCLKNNIKWTGYDINPAFVEAAKKQNYNAMLADLMELEHFEKADTCLIIGSLYHFQNTLEILFAKMFECSSTVIISEPIKNLSQKKGIIGKLAKGSSDINGLDHSFRFNEETLFKRLNELSEKFNFKMEVIDKFNKDIILKLTK